MAFYYDFSQIAYGSGANQTSSDTDKMDVSLKWSTCKIANKAQISKIKYGPFLVKMRYSHWMWDSFCLSGLFLVA